MSNPRPRWLEIAEQEEDATSVEDITERLTQANALVGLTEHPAWEAFTTELKVWEQQAIDSLLNPTETQDMTVVAAYRARVRVLRWIIGYSTRVQMDRDNLQTQAAEEGEQDDG